MHVAADFQHMAADLLFYYNINSAAINYLHADFAGKVNHGNTTRDHFKLGELSLRFYLSERFKILAH